jgi:hypothetical protein
MPLPVNSNLVPQAGKASFVTEDIYIKGGFRSVATKKIRDQINVASRKAGMIVYVADMDKYYKLKPDLSSWLPWTGGSSSAGGDAAAAFGVMEVVSVVEPTEISPSWFAANSVGAFDVVDCPESPNYDDVVTTDFMGFHFGSADGARMIQIGFGVMGGTNGMFIRSKPNAAAAEFGEWLYIEGNSVAKSTYDLRPSSRHSKLAHGFTVGKCIAVDSTGNFIGARSDNASTCEVVGFITDVPDEDTFELTTPNTYAKDMFVNLTPGHVYYVSSSVAGSLVDAVPTTPGFVNKPVMIATSATSGILLNQRGVIIPDVAATANVVALNTATVDANKLLVVENNFGAISPLVQVQDNAGFVRNDVKIKVAAANITFDFTDAGTISGTWKAVVYA